MTDEVQEHWDLLKDMKQIPADGIFFCKNEKGEKVVLIYNKEHGIFMTCGVGDCDHGMDFEERH